MEHGLSVVVVQYVLPDGQIAFLIQVVGAVDEFHKAYIGIKKFLDVVACALHASESHMSVHGTHAV